MIQLLLKISWIQNLRNSQVCQVEREPGDIAKLAFPMFPSLAANIRSTAMVTALARATGSTPDLFVRLMAGSFMPFWLFS